MADTGDPSAIRPARGAWRTRQRMAAGTALVLIGSLSALWLERRPIAAHFIDRELARRGVPARYTVTDLGFGRQRLTDVVVGDPARPDLVADWVETETRVGLFGARLTGLRTGHVRLRGRIVGGRLSLGSLDRFATGGAGQPFALPALLLDVADAGLALATPAGGVTLHLAGRGRANDGFRGRLTIADAGQGLGSPDCRVGDLSADLAISVDNGKPRLIGPVTSGGGRCGGLLVAGPRLMGDVTFGAALDRWTGKVSAQAGVTRDPAAARGSAFSPAPIVVLAGDATFNGTASQTDGRLALGGPARWKGWGRAARVGASGSFQVGGVNAFQGKVDLAGVELAPGRLRLEQAAMLDGTPLGPIAERVLGATRAAARRFDAGASVLIQRAQGVSTLQVSRVELAAASGARASFAGGRAFDWQSGTNAWTAGGRLVLAGGGMPEVRAELNRDARGGVRGTAVVAPYAAGGSRLALAPLRFAVAPNGAAQVTTLATVTGPIPGGRVERLAVPLDATVDAAGRWSVGHHCLAVGWQRLVAGGLALDPARVALCPTGGAIVASGGGVGGARLAATALKGRLGSSALDLRVGGATLALGTRGFDARDLAVRLGDPARPVRIEAARLGGTLGKEGLAGSFGGASGQIGAVPLILSGAAGDWRFVSGRLALTGALQVADAADPPRFQPLAAREVALSLADGTIHATGTLAEPATGTRVAAVAIDHALASGVGEARLDVASIAFTAAFQPDRLTRLTFGVVADVRGTVSGQARIAWSPAGVTSTGSFGTEGLDLAAAFGPVTGIATRIRFTDLLSLTSATGQVATVRTINPGIAVENGTIHFQTLPDARIRVEDGRWPFAGGTLTLAPTLLDFGEQRERRMTFKVDGVAADQFLQQFDFKNLQATGTFDGTLPMVFDVNGGRIEHGRLTVRPGGGSLAYLGEISRENLGFWGNLAFGALRSLRYRDLSIDMNGPLAGEMITDVRFSGVTQGAGATSNFLIRRLQRLPFVFNVRIAAPFRGLIDSAQSFYDPKRLIDRQRLTAPVQPPASEKRP